MRWSRRESAPHSRLKGSTMSDVSYFNRYTGNIEREEIYGEPYLRWVYETKVGRLSLCMLVKRRFLSRYYGWKMDRPASRGLIAPFIAKYRLDPEEFLQDPGSFRSFNEFFYRKLKRGARPLCKGGKRTLALPADGRHLAVARVGQEDGVYAKGQRLSLSGLLGDGGLAAQFEGGCCIISRLCPLDYHRYHSPAAGRIERQWSLPGPLFSVSPIALRRRLGYLWQNKRVVSLLDSESFGRIAYIAIGATLVGTVAMTKFEGDVVAKGEELGYFAFGGSCVITLLEPNRATLEPDLAKFGAQSIEVYAKFGDQAATAS